MSSIHHHLGESLGRGAWCLRWGMAALVAALMAAPAVHGQNLVKADEVPKSLEDVGIEQRLDAQIPLNLAFRDSTGRDVRLGDYFNGEKPIIVTLNYFTCPMLCELQYQDLVGTLKDMKAKVGEDFEILTISFDPLDRPRAAKLKKDNALDALGDPSASAGWHFLVGTLDNIKPLTESVGFSYRWNEDEQEWAHSAATIVCTPTGRVSRYFSFNNESELVRMSLVEASQGKVGSLFDQLFLWCYHYDPSRGDYAPVARNIMQLGGALTLGVLGLVLGGFWLIEHRRRATRRGAVASGLDSSRGPEG